MSDSQRRLLSDRNAPSARSALPRDPPGDAGPAHGAEPVVTQRNAVGLCCIGRWRPRYSVSESRDEMAEAPGVVTAAVAHFGSTTSSQPTDFATIPHRLGFFTGR